MATTPAPHSSSEDCSSVSSSASSHSSAGVGGMRSSSGSLGSPTPPASPTVNGHGFGGGKSGTGPKYKLLHEGDIQLCRLNHTRTIVSKIMNSRYLRRWESHRLILGDGDVQSTTPTGFMEHTIPYSSIEEVNIISRWDAGQKFCIRITIPDGSLLLQANNAYLRDQWLHSVQWKRHMLKYEKLLTNTKRPEVLIKEIKEHLMIDPSFNSVHLALIIEKKCGYVVNMIDLSLTTPIQDVSVYQFPLDLVSQLLQENIDTIGQVAHEQIIVALAPLLENNHPTQEICDFFSKHCKNSPRSEIVIELFTPVVQRILKHNMDFGKYPRMRTFIQEYIQALSSQNDGIRVVQTFVASSMHGQTSTCPHPRVLPNLVAVCLAAIYNCYEQKKNLLQGTLNNHNDITMETDHRFRTYVSIFYTIQIYVSQELAKYITDCLDIFNISLFHQCPDLELVSVSEFEDWRPHLGSLLQPIPFPDDALAHETFTREMKGVIRNLSDDTRCDVHQTILGIRESKEGWFHLYCPGGIACDDEGELFGIMLRRLIGCCCRRKKFLEGMQKMISPCMLLALRENEAAMDVLCAMLEYEIIESSDLKMQIITTLQSTSVGKRMYAALCERQIQLRELQQKGGPRKLTLPSKSTDADLAKMLSSGSFGNLECLSLAFTQVTSACAADLIKLPSLRYLNLWSTQFGDQGLQLLSEHLQKLQVLNLCETPVSDKGLSCLSSMKNLRKLNLNSTHLSALVFEGLKEKLPALQECDVRYTDAW